MNAEGLSIKQRALGELVQRNGLGQSSSAVSHCGKSIKKKWACRSSFLSAHWMVGEHICTLCPVSNHSYWGKPHQPGSYFPHVWKYTSEKVMTEYHHHLMFWVQSKDQLRLAQLQKQSPEEHWKHSTSKNQFPRLPISGLVRQVSLWADIIVRNTKIICMRLINI